MAKAKSAFVCTECGAEYRKWQGQCSSCNEWNTLTEIRLASARPGGSASSTGRGGYAGDLSRDVVDLSNVDLSEVPRLSSTFAEFDRVLGGGLVPGSAVLLGGNPGAGKSTLLL
ncbi:DNA repair protein RadA, partial [Halomonas sp. 707D4]|nr:DNA repair protein RadA [Halomonas sp. 707D4]